MSQNKRTRILISTICFQIWVGTMCNLNAQTLNSNSITKSTDSPRVEWVNTWPSDSYKHRSRNVKDQINSILFGIKTPLLSNPVSIVADNPNEFWVLDQGNKLLFEVKEGVGDIPHSVFKTDFDLSSLVGICAGSNSSILFTDSKAQKIYKISPGQKKLQILNDTLVLHQPTGIAYSPERKEIYVVETKAHRITVLNENGELIRRIGSRGNSPGMFNYPTHICIDSKGHLYITDAMNFRIQVLNSNGEVLSVFGQAGDSTGHFASPKGIATDSFGNIYVVDALFHVVQVFDIKGVFLYKFGNQGHGNAEFWMPTGIFIDKNDNIYVADSYNSRVQMFQLKYSVRK
jgi:hypothetical protein